MLNIPCASRICIYAACCKQTKPLLALLMAPCDYYCIFCLPQKEITDTGLSLVLGKSSKPTSLIEQLCGKFVRDNLLVCNSDLLCKPVGECKRRTSIGATAMCQVDISQLAGSAFFLSLRLFTAYVESSAHKSPPY